MLERYGENRMDIADQKEAEIQHEYVKLARVSIMNGAKSQVGKYLTAREVANLHLWIEKVDAEMEHLRGENERLKQLTDSAARVMRG